MASCEVNTDLSVDVRIRQSNQVTELFISVRPKAPADPAAQADAMMAMIASLLRQHHAVILQERIFADASVMALLAESRARSYGQAVDPIGPTWLVVPENTCGPISGIQIHAVAGSSQPSLLYIDDEPHGRLLQYGRLRYLTGCNLLGDPEDPPASQARMMLLKAEQLLAQSSATLADISRTWMWLGNILDWYNDFNRTRSDLFKDRGLLKPDATGNLPASTGIGIGPAGHQQCAMDFCATLEGPRPRFLLGASRQGPASKYGSAFSRAAVAGTPAGTAVYVSGTAAIDPAGQTTHIGDARGQIEDTIQNIRGVLTDAGTCEQDIVHAIVYCKDRRVEQIFRQTWGNWPIPYILAIADVCRENLLFEIEVTAMPL
ncbi:MAG TPA: Rid family hydrolase [Tepidisphaeraceae bacterium]|nr:Rid family hydrolase [Tepidisphaeraceae bacterium]